MSSNKQRDRKCATCRHYQASPLWRKGWCRNPLLFDPGTNHLVEADSLACARAFIDYWEPRATPERGGWGARPPGVTDETQAPRPRVAPAIPLTPTGPGGAPLYPPASRAATAEALVPAREKPPLTLVRPPDPALESHPGPGRPPDGLPDDTRATAILPTVAPAPAPAAPPTVTIRVQGVVPEPAPQTVPAPPPTRLRWALIALVVLGLGALAVIVGPKLVRTPQPVALTLTPSPLVSPTLPLYIPPLNLSPTVVVTVAPPTPVPPPPHLAVGAAAVVFNTGGSGLRVRQQPSAQGRILAKVADGARLQIKGGPQTVGKTVWWQVSGFDSKNTLGWCVADYLKAVP